MLVEMDYFQIYSYLLKVKGYGMIESEVFADFFTERGWDSLDIDKYIENSTWYIVSPEEDIDEYIRNCDSEDYITFKADNGYTYLEFY